MKAKLANSKKTENEVRLYVKIAHEINDLLLLHDIKEGDRLPSETELSKDLGVSRATVREAIVALEVSGVLTVRRNVGAVVLNRSENVQTHIINSEAGPFEQIQVRMLLEPESAKLAAINRSTTQCERMEKAIEMMIGETQAGFETEEGDMQFHMTIAKASQNSLLESHLKSLWEMRNDGKLWSQLQRSVDLNSTRTRAVYHHMRILECIRSQDPERAKQAMTEHLISVNAELESTISK